MRAITPMVPMRDRHADTQGSDDAICFRVISVLERVIPLIEHLHDGAAEANRHNRGDR